ncbi:MAG: sigma-70 family RNA polymerase sigma factor [Gemmatimonadota bacterium]
MDEHDLKSLAVAFREGDEGSFRVLVDSLSRTLIAMAYRYSVDWEWARDLTQDTWIKVHRQIGRWDPHRSFSAWIHAIHRNGCLDHLRRGWVRYESTPGDEVISRMRGPTPGGPEEDLERREFHERLVVALGHLSESQRQVFLRVDMEREDQKSVAHALGIKPGTLRTTLHFARKRLATMLREMEKST